MCRIEKDALEVTQLAQQGTGCDDPKAYPDTPDVPTQDGDDLVAEELYSAQHDRQVSHVLNISPNRSHSRVGRTGRT